MCKKGESKTNSAGDVGVILIAKVNGQQGNRAAGRAYTCTPMLQQAISKMKCL